MAECATDENEKRRLLELCSLQGSEDYVQLIREQEINIIDMLTTFASVRLPVERFLEQVSRLLPRPYSISSSPLKVHKEINKTCGYKLFIDYLSRRTRRSVHSFLMWWTSQWRMGERTRERAWLPDVLKSCLFAWKRMKALQQITQRRT